MPTYSFGGWGFGVSLVNLLRETIDVHAKQANLNTLGSTDALRHTRLAEMVNRAVEEFIEANPAIGITTATQALTADDGTYAIPASLHGVDIERIMFSNTGSDPYYDLVELSYLTPSEIAGLPASWRNGDYTNEKPLHWGFDDTATSIVIYPIPSAAPTLVIHYRPEPTLVTQTNVSNAITGTPDTTINEMPTRFQNVLAMNVAIRLLAAIDPESGRLASLEGRYSNPDPNRPGELQKAQRTITNVPAYYKTGNQNSQRPAGLFNRHAVFAGLSRN